MSTTRTLYLEAHGPSASGADDCCDYEVDVDILRGGEYEVRSCRVLLETGASREVTEQDMEDLEVRAPEHPRLGGYRWGTRVGDFVRGECDDMDEDAAWSHAEHLADLRGGY